jgi:hypothetical protein
MTWLSINPIFDALYHHRIFKPMYLAVIANAYSTKRTFPIDGIGTGLGNKGQAKNCIKEEK